CFQAEDGIRDDLVTGVQTCAFRSLAVELMPWPAVGATRMPSPLVVTIEIPAPDVPPPTSLNAGPVAPPVEMMPAPVPLPNSVKEIGRASCREGGGVGVVAAA